MTNVWSKCIFYVNLNYSYFLFIFHAIFLSKYFLVWPTFTYIICWKICKIKFFKYFSTLSKKKNYHYRYFTRLHLFYFFFFHKILAFFPYRPNDRCNNKKHYLNIYLRRIVYVVFFFFRKKSHILWSYASLTNLF